MGFDKCLHIKFSYLEEYAGLKEVNGLASVLAGKLYGREPVMVIPAKTPCRKTLKSYFGSTPRYHLGGTGKSCVTRWWRSVDPGRTRS